MGHRETLQTDKGEGGLRWLRMETERAGQVAFVGFPLWVRPGLAEGV